MILGLNVLRIDMNSIYAIGMDKEPVMMVRWNENLEMLWLYVDKIPEGLTKGWGWFWNWDIEILDMECVECRDR